MSDKSAASLRRMRRDLRDRFDNESAYLNILMHGNYNDYITIRHILYSEYSSDYIDAEPEHWRFIVFIELINKNHNNIFDVDDCFIAMEKYGYVSDDPDLWDKETYEMENFLDDLVDLEVLEYSGEEHYRVIVDLRA